MTCQKLILKWLDNSIKKYADDNLLKNNNLMHININIHIDIITISNPYNIITSDNLYGKISKISIKDLF